MINTPACFVLWKSNLVVQKDVCIPPVLNNKYGDRARSEEKIDPAEALIGGSQVDVLRG